MNATLFLSSDDDGNIGIVLSNKAPASMKNDLYEDKVACTENKLLACKCDCTSGGEKNERVTCAHCLPVNTQLSMLLMDGLAEH
eukprot:12048453-Ditylum_brightwellii.AAC.1